MAFNSSLKKLGSLRTRIILIVLIMLLPASVLMYSSYNTITTNMNTINRIVDTPLSKLVSAKRVQTKILRTELPFHLYLNRGETADRDSFIKRSIEIDILFDTILKTENFSEDDTELLRSSRDEWQNAKTLGESLLTITNIPPNHILIEKVDQFGRHLERSASLLDEVAELSLEKINDIQLSAHNNEWRNIGILILIYGLGTLLAILGTLSLDQSIIEPLLKLRQRVLQFAEGHTHTKIEISSNNELGDLALAFNALAERHEHIKSEIEHLSTQDGLTGLFDQTHLNKEIDMEIERAKRYGRTFSILLININNFAEINSTYGRLIGDSVLCSVANTIHSTIRLTDLAARFGGNEFAIILSETDSLGSHETTQRLFEAIESEPLNIGDGKTVKISVRIGYATYPTQADSGSALFALTKKTLTRSRFNQKIKLHIL